jgi:hypothetical protein
VASPGKAAAGNAFEIMSQNSNDSATYSLSYPCSHWRKNRKKSYRETNEEEEKVEEE